MYTSMHLVPKFAPGTCKYALVHKYAPVGILHVNQYAPSTLGAFLQLLSYTVYKYALSSLGTLICTWYTNMHLVQLVNANMDLASYIVQKYRGGTDTSEAFLWPRYDYLNVQI